MDEYELITEGFNPCGGKAHSSREFKEVETDDPIEFVKNAENSDSIEIISINGDETIIEAGKNGYIKRYYFTKL